MIATEDYLGRSRLFQRLKSGPHRQFIDIYAARLIKDGLAHQGTWRSLNLVRGLLDWIITSRSKLRDLDESMVERYLRHRARKQSVQPGDHAALKRLLAVLRVAGAIVSPVPATTTPQDQAFKEFSDYLQLERGLAPRTIIRHLPVIRQFLCEVCPAGAGDLAKISPEDITRYVERHARDWSAASGKAMCWSLRAFLRYPHYGGLNPLALAGCVPSIRGWSLASPHFSPRPRHRHLVPGRDPFQEVRARWRCWAIAQTGLRGASAVFSASDPVF